MVTLNCWWCLPIEEAEVGNTICTCGWCASTPHLIIDFYKRKKGPSQKWVQRCKDQNTASRWDMSPGSVTCNKTPQSARWVSDLTWTWRALTESLKGVIGQSPFLPQSQRKLLLSWAQYWNRYEPQVKEDWCGKTAKCSDFQSRHQALRSSPTTSPWGETFISTQLVLLRR